LGAFFFAKKLYFFAMSNKKKQWALHTNIFKKNNRFKLSRELEEYKFGA